MEMLALTAKKISDLPQEEKTALENFKNTINSVFELKNITKDSFELYNLVNEKTYIVKPLIKMINYRKIFKGSFFICRIILFKGEYFLFSLDKVIKNSDSLTAYKKAVSIQVENSSSLYADNDEKFRQLEQNVAFLHEKFNEFFKTKEIITINTNLEKILDTFNEYVEEGGITHNIDEFIEIPQKYSYFDTAKIQKTYDVAIMYDPQNGIQTIPFFATFCRIFEVENPESVDGYKSCINMFLNNDDVPVFVLKTVYERFGEKFLSVIKQSLEISEEIDFDGLMRRYKSKFLNNKIFSTTTVLYSSESFEKLMKLSAKPKIAKPAKDSKAGRNTPCPCGSGKKYKKCCL